MNFPWIWLSWKTSGWQLKADLCWSLFTKALTHFKIIWKACWLAWYQSCWDFLLTQHRFFLHRSKPDAYGGHTHWSPSPHEKSCVIFMGQLWYLPVLWHIWLSPSCWGGLLKIPSNITAVVTPQRPGGFFGLQLLNMKVQIAEQRRWIVWPKFQESYMLHETFRHFRLCPIMSINLTTVNAAKNHQNVQMPL